MEMEMISRLRVQITLINSAISYY